MKYASQKVALVYFVGAMALFVVQLLFGLLAAAVYTMPNFASQSRPVRASIAHTWSGTVKYKTPSTCTGVAETELPKPPPGPPGFAR